MGRRGFARAWGGGIVHYGQRDADYGNKDEHADIKVGKGKVVGHTLTKGVPHSLHNLLVATQRAHAGLLQVVPQVRV